MCGLFGAMSSYLTTAELGKVKMLGILSMFRGIQATGIATCKRGKKNRRQYYVHKGLMNSATFLEEDDLTETMMEGSMAVLGHCRLPTLGGNTLDNAHPHRCEHIIGAHNGTIHEFQKLPQQREEGSDSKVLFTRLSKEPLEAVLQDTGWTGAYALSYFDTRKGTLNFIRNKDRPLWLMYNNGKTTVYWASEKIFLEFVKQREGQGFHEDPWLLKEDLLLTFEVGNLKNSEQKEIKVKKEFVWKDNRSDYWKDDNEKWRDCYGDLPLLGGASRRGNHFDHRESLEARLNRTKKTGTASVPIIKRAGNPKETHVTYIFMYTGPSGNPIQLAEANAMLAAGCDWCQMGKDQSDIVHWLDPTGNYICGSCGESNGFAKQYMKAYSKHLGQLVKVPLTDVDYFTEQSDKEVSI